MTAYFLAAIFVGLISPKKVFKHSPS